MSPDAATSAPQAPSRTRAQEDHLQAWIAGWLAAAESQTSEAYKAGHHAGYLAALRAVAVNMAELDIIGGTKDRQFRSQAAARVRARHQALEDAAEVRYLREGRTEYRGGPVTWGGEAT